MPYGLHNFIILLITVLLTWFVYVDSHRLPMKHRNFWIIGTFLMAPLVFLVYLIRRAQVKHHQALSKRSSGKLRPGNGPGRESSGRTRPGLCGRKDTVSSWKRILNWKPSGRRRLIKNSMKCDYAWMNN